MKIMLTETQIAICKSMGVDPEDYARQLGKDKQISTEALKTKSALTKDQCTICELMGVDPADYVRELEKVSSISPEALKSQEGFTARDKTDVLLTNPDIAITALRVGAESDISHLFGEYEDIPDLLKNVADKTR